jgi:hypothetical protein
MNKGPSRDVKSCEARSSSRLLEEHGESKEPPPPLTRPLAPPTPGVSGCGIDAIRDGYATSAGRHVRVIIEWPGAPRARKGREPPMSGAGRGGDGGGRERGLPHAKLRLGLVARAHY